MSDTERYNLVIRYAKDEPAPEKRRCAVCRNELDVRPVELGPELFIETTGEVVCPDCGWLLAPELVLAARAAQCYREQESKAKRKQPQPDKTPGRTKAAQGTDSGWHFG